MSVSPQKVKGVYLVEVSKQNLAITRYAKLHKYTFKSIGHENNFLQTICFNVKCRKKTENFLKHGLDMDVLTDLLVGRKSLDENERLKDFG